MQFFSGPGNVWLTEMNENLILHILDRFNIKPLAILRASVLGIQGHKDERIFQMCEETGADTYLSGRGAADYHQPEEYMLRGIDLIYTDYEPAQYQQLYGSSSRTCLCWTTFSTADMKFLEGVEDGGGATDLRHLYPQL